MLGFFFFAFSGLVLGKSKWRSIDTPRHVICYSTKMLKNKSILKIMFWGAAKGAGKTEGLTFGAVEILFAYYPSGSPGKLGCFLGVFFVFGLFFSPTMELENKKYWHLERCTIFAALTALFFPLVICVAPLDFSSSPFTPRSSPQHDYLESMKATQEGPWEKHMSPL